MAQPYNYLLNIPSPTQNVLQSVQLGSGIQQVQGNQRNLEASRQMQADLAALSANPTPAAITKMMVRYPQLSEQFSRAHKAMSDDQQKAQIRQASDLYAVVQSGNIDLAETMLKERAAAYRNSGMESQAKIQDDLAELIRVSPKSALTSIGMGLAATMGPDEFTSTFTGLQGERREAERAPALLTEAQSRARSAAVASEFAESQAVADLSKKGWDIWKLQEDAAVARENTRIAALNAKLKKTDDDLRRRELEQKILDRKEERDKMLREQTASLNSARMNIDNFLSSADRILNTPRAVMENAMGPVSSRILTMRQETADFEELINNLDAQAFLSQIPNMKGLGALSDVEGQKIAKALQNFSLRQSPERLRENISEAQRLLQKSRRYLADEYGMPDTLPDTPFVETDPADIEALVNRYTQGAQ